MATIGRRAHAFEPLSANEALLLWEEKERLRIELERALAVAADVAEEDPSSRAALLTEVHRLQEVVVSLRLHLDWSINGETRYTSVME